MQDKKAFDLWPFVIKTILVLVTIGFLYFEIFEKHKLASLLEMYQVSFKEHSFWYGLLFVLMLLNWCLETAKWRFLLSDSKGLISFGKAFQAVWTGVSISLFTPNRVGEFGGRMLFFAPQERLKAVSATLAGSLGQFTATILFGFAGFAFYLVFAGHPRFQADPWIFFVSLGSIVLALYFYFRIKVMAKWLSNRKWHEKISEAATILSEYTKRQLLINLSISALRYVVFAFQMGIVLYVLVDFQNDFNFWQITYVIFTYFLIQTAVPSIALSEIGVRGAVLSVLLVHIVGQSQVAPLVLAGTLLWFLNIIIPAMFGVAFIYGTKIKFRTS
jgi:uncharacterized membrane protein YbhN (UPF0104 family)